MTANDQQAILVQRLKEKELSIDRFLKVGPDKAAFEINWEQHLYSPKDLGSYPRWGICGKDFLVLIDTDKKEMCDLISKVLPETFEVTSPRRGLPHKYYCVCGEQVPNKTLYIEGDVDEKGRPNGAGEIRAKNEYLVAPGTEITFKDKDTGKEKTGMYVITKNIPIARIEYADFMAAVKPFFGKNQGQSITPEEMANGVSAGMRHAKGIRYANHLIGKVKLDAQTAFFEMRRWNQLNNPPMEEKDLKRQVRDACRHIAQENNIPLEQVIGCGGIKNPIFAELDKDEKPLKYPTYTELFPWNKEEDKPAPFKPAIISQWLFEHDHFKTDEKTDMLYFGNEKTGMWTREGETQLKKIVTKILGEEDRECHYRNILHSLKSLTYSEICFSEKIALENGLFDLETQTLTPFSLNEMAFHAIPIKFVKEARKLDNWLEFLKQVAIPEDVPLLQEWFGYCFLPDYRFHKVLWIHGEGRNGKGVFDRTIKGMLGTDNYSTVGLERLDGTQRFVLKDLYGKLYNSSSEPISNKIFQTEIFQKITGQDAIDAEFKNANKEKRFINAAKLTIIGNKFPKIKQPTQAFKDRMGGMFVKFPNHFDDNAQTQNLESVWLNDPEQRSSIFNWAMEGLQRLLSQHHFSVRKTQLETEIMFNRVTDNIAAFQMECGLYQKNLATARADTLKAYQDYCEEIGVEPRKASELTQGMQRLAPKVKDGWIYKPKKDRAWVGFGLKNREQTTMEQMEQMEQQNILSKYADNYLENKKDKNSVPSVPSVPNPEKAALGDTVFHFQQVNARVESHKCDNPKCPNEKAVLAEFKQVLSEYDAKDIGKEALYFCNDCFKEASGKAEANGVRCVLDPMEEQGEVS